MKTFKTLAALCFVTAAFVAPAQAAVVQHDGTMPQVKTCPSRNSCDAPDQNGPSLDGFVEGDQPTSKHVRTAPGVKTCPSKGNCEPPDQNGPSLDGFVATSEAERTAPGIKSCTIRNTCDLPDPNGPSLDGFAEGDQPKQKPLHRQKMVK